MDSRAAIRLARISTVTQVAIIIGIVVLVAIPIALVFGIELSRALLPAHVGEASSDLTLGARLLIAATVAVPAAVMLCGLLAARAMFADFKAGRVFTPTAARKLQVFAAAVLAQAVMGPLTVALVSLVSTTSSPPGDGLVAISISSQDWFAAIVGGVLLATATVMREAARLAEDNAAIV